MNIELLRRWVRDELDPIQRREVGRWMLRSSDQGLPEVLHGLVREHEEALANTALLARSPARAFVVDLWGRLLDSGRASIEALRPAALAGGAVLGAAKTSTGLAFRRVEGDLFVDVVIANEERMVAVFATTDLGDEHLLLDPVHLSPGTYPDVTRWTPEVRDGRVVLWLVLAPGGTDAERLRTLRSVDGLVGSGSVEVFAARWSDPA